MGRIETKQIPKELHPAGERILKIMYDDKEPPKNYVWCKDDEYFIWDGKKWVPYEFELIKDKGCIQKNCTCITKDEMAVKFDKFKKDVLAAVLKMNQSQDATNISDIRAQLAEIKVLVRDLEALENYYTKEEIDENHYNKSEIDSKTEILTNLTTMLNGSVGSMSRRLSGLETNLSDILPVVNRLNQIDHSQFVTARDVSDVYDLDPGEYIGNLDGYATQEYVDNAIANVLGGATEDYVNQAIANVVGSAPEALDTLKELGDALNNDANFATTITTALANKADKSEIPQAYDDTSLVNRIENLENKPFDTYLTNDDGLVISTSLNSLNDRLTEVESFDQRIENLENHPFDEYLTTDDEFIISEGINDLNSRISELENKQDEKGLTEQEELLIASTFNDLNNRVSELENNCVVTDNSN